MATISPFLKSPFQELIDRQEPQPMPGSDPVVNVEMPQIEAAPVVQAVPQPEPQTFAPKSGKKASLAPPPELRPLFAATAEHFGVPENVLMAIAQQESSYNANAVNKETGASGIAQYMGATAKALGINALDPNEAIPNTARQIRERLDNGASLEDAIKEHFAGPNRKLWGSKTAAYGKEVLAKAEQIGAELYGEAPQQAEPEKQNAFAADRMARAEYEANFKAMNPKASPDALAAVMAQYDEQASARTKAKANSVQDRFNKLKSPEAMFDERLNAKLQAKNRGVAQVAPERQQPVDVNSVTHERPGVMEQAQGDFGRGISNLKALGYGVGGLVAEQMGNDEAATRMLDEYVAIQDDIAKNNPATIGTYKNVKSLGDAGRYAVEAVAENLPMLLPSLVTGGIGAQIGKKAAERVVAGMIETQVAKGVAREVAEKQAAQFVAKRIMQGSIAGAAPASIGMESGSIMGDIYQETGEKRPGLALAGGIPAGLLDTIQPVMALRKIAGPVVDEVAGGIVKRMGREAGLQFLTEAGTEGLQTVIEEFAAAKAANRDMSTDHIIDAMLKGGIGGGVMGVASQGVNEARGAIKGRPAASPPPGQIDAALQKNQQVSATPTRPAGPLTTALSSAANVQADDEGFTAQVLGDDGQMYTLDSRTGVVAPAEPAAPSGPLEAAISDAAEQHAADPAPAPIQPEAEPAAPDYTAMALPDLQARLKDIAEQAKASPQARQQLMPERKQIEQAVNAKLKEAKEASKPAEEPLAAGPFEDIKAANRMMLRFVESTGTPHEVVGEEKTGYKVRKLSGSVVEYGHEKIPATNRNRSDLNVRNVEVDPTQMLRQGRYQLPQVRGAGDRDVSALEGKLPPVRKGRGGAPEQGIHDGSNRREEGLLSGERALGDQKGASAESVKQRPSDIQRENASGGRVGAGDGDVAGNSDGSTQEGLDDRARPNGARSKKDAKAQVKPQPTPHSEANDGIDAAAQGRTDGLGRSGGTADPVRVSDDGAGQPSGIVPGAKPDGAARGRGTDAATDRTGADVAANADQALSDDTRPKVNPYANRRFSAPEKGEAFIDKEGIDRNHFEVVQTGPARWQVLPRLPKSDAAEVKTNVPERQEVPEEAPVARGEESAQQGAAAGSEAAGAGKAAAPAAPAVAGKPKRPLYQREITNAKQEEAVRKAAESLAARKAKKDGGTKLADKDGKPLVVYHGSTEKLPAKMRSGEPVYVTTDRGYADSFNPLREGETASFTADIRNPYYATEQGEIDGIKYSKEAIAKLKEQGYDGAIYKGGKGPQQALVFDADQLTRVAEPQQAAAEQPPAPTAAPAYRLPEDVGTDWRRAEALDFEPDARQKIVMDAVEKALANGVFYNRDMDEKVAEALGVGADVRSRKNSGTEGGDFGYDVYMARKAVEAKQRHAEIARVQAEQNFKAGDVLGTLIFNDFKVNTGVTVEAVNGDQIKLRGKRGAYSVTMETGPTNIKYAIERAHEKGKRKDSYEEFIASRNEAAPAKPKRKPAAKKAAPEQAEEAEGVRYSVSGDIGAVSHLRDGIGAPVRVESVDENFGTGTAFVVEFDNATVQMSVREESDGIYVIGLQAKQPGDLTKPVRGTGRGREIMESLKQYADQTGKPLNIMGVTEGGANFWRSLPWLHPSPVSLEMAGDMQTDERGFIYQPQGVRYSVSGDVTDSPAFRRWFEGSAVVDSGGKPLMVFHGTDQDFNSFAKEKLGEATGAQSAAQGFFFVSRPDVATSYANYAAMQAPVRRELLQSERAEKRGDWDGYDAALQRAEELESEIADRPQRGQNVLPVYLSIKNPAIMDAEGELFMSIQDKINAFIKVAKRKGHDGVILRNLDDDPNFSDRVGDHYIAFQPEQIKSAIGNNGEFSPDNPDIRYSAAAMVEDALPAVSPFIQALADAGAIELHADASTLPVKGRVPQGVQALTTADGRIHVVASALNSNAKGIVLHEAFHAGGKALVGSKAWSDLMARLGSLYRQYEKSGGAARTFWDKARARVATAKAKGAVADGMEHEEFGAYAIEEYENAPLTVRKWVDDLLGAVKAWALRRFGRQLGQVTPAQLSALAKLALLDVQSSRAQEAFSTDDRRAEDRGTEDRRQTVQFEGERRPIENSRGTLIAEDMNKQLAFYRWFKDSQVVDEQQRPRVVFHGTNVDFDAFKSDKTGSSWDAGKLGKGFYFSTDPRLASSYATNARAKSRDDAPSIMPVYLSIQNPLEIGPLDWQAGENLWDKLRDFSEQAGIDIDPVSDPDSNQPNPEWSEPFRDALKRFGYDGVMLKFSDGHQELVAFDPEQIKSSVGNSGSFSSDTTDIRYSVAGDPQPRELTPDNQSLLRRVQEVGQDRMNRINQIQKTIEREFGVEIAEGDDTYLKDTNRPGKVSARQEDGEDRLLKPMVKKLADSGYKLSDLEELLHAMHAKERNAYVATINPKHDPDSPEYEGTQGSGMNDDKAERIIEKYEGAAELHQIANQARAIAKRTLDLQLEYQLINKETHERLTKTYEYYVPLKGDGEYGVKIKRAMGHGERDENILEHLSRDYNQVIAKGERNLVVQSLIRLALKFPDDSTWTVRVPPKGRYVAGKVYNIVHVGPGAPTNGETVASFESHSQVTAWLEAKGAEARHYKVLDSNGEQVVEFTKPLQDNEVMGYIQGDAVRMQIHDEALARQIRPLDVKQLNMFVRGLAKIHRWYATVYTAYSPTFIFTNVIRDAGSGTINMLGNYGAGVAAEAWLKHYAKASAALLYWSKSHNAPQGKTGQYLNEYRAQGGKTGAAHMSDLEQQRESFQRMYDDAYGAFKYAKDGRVDKAALIAARKTVMGLAKTIEMANVATENSLRLALFITLRERGVSPGKAAAAAKNVTVNFDRKGTATGFISAFYLFFNPRVQGAANALRTLTSGKHKYQAWTALGMMATAGYFMAAAGMDEDKDRWLGTKWDTRSKKLIFFNGDKTIEVPVTQEYAPAMAAGVALAEVVRGESPTKSGARLMASIADAYVPIDVAHPDSDNPMLDFMLGIMPTNAQILLRSANNRSAFGSEIVPESDNTKDQPDNFKMNRATKGTVYDRAAQVIASGKLPVLDKTIGETFGNRKYANDWSKISPETLKMLWGTAAGGLGNFVADSAGLGVLAKEGAQQIISDDVPVLKAFYKTNDSKPLRNRFYELADESKRLDAQVKQAIKQGDELAARDIMQGDDAIFWALVEANEATRKITALRAEQAVAINADKTLSVPEKRAKLKELDALMEQDYRKAISNFRP